MTVLLSVKQLHQLTEDGKLVIICRVECSSPAISLVIGGGGTIISHQSFVHGGGGTIISHLSFVHGGGGTIISHQSFVHGGGGSTVIISHVSVADMIRSRSSIFIQLPCLCQSIQECLVKAPNFKQLLDGGTLIFAGKATCTGFSLQYQQDQQDSQPSNS